MKSITLSIIIPCYNEERVVGQTVLVVEENIRLITCDYEIILIDDGSRDQTYQQIVEISAANEHIRGIRFTRNFGKEAAIQAGIHQARGKAVIIMDADLQHPPALISTLYRHWKDDGYDVVEAIKSYQEKGGIWQKLRSRFFNWFMRRMTGLQMKGASDYKLLDRKVVEQLLEISERNRFFRGLVNWTGFRTKQISFQVQERAGGETKWSIISLLKLAISAATSFSNIPLQIITGLGFLTMVFSVILGFQTLYKQLSGHAVSGFATVIILNLLLNAVLMISLGIIGTYVGHIYTESKRRPFYVVADETEKKGKGKEKEERNED
jgi:glycosyltransferase involved in cell wall biosynthesis